MHIYFMLFTIVVIALYFETYCKTELNEIYEIGPFQEGINLVCIVVMALVSGTRLLGGSDYYIYKNAYETLPGIIDVLFMSAKVTSNPWIAGFDKGYLLIMEMFKMLGVNFHVFCLIHSLFFDFSLYKGLKKYCTNFSIVLVVFLAKIFFYDTFISMRQSITIAIFFLSMKLIENKKWIAYLMVALICTFIHGGAIILFLVYLVVYIPMSPRKFVLYISIFSPFAIMNFFNINLFAHLLGIIGKIISLFSVVWANKINSYLSTSTNGISLFYIIEYLLIAFLVVLCFDDELWQDPHVLFILKIFICLWPIYTLFGGIDIITREKDYFILSYGLIVSYLLKIKEGKHSFITVNSVIAIGCFEFFRYIILFDNGELINYASWLFN